MVVEARGTFYEPGPPPQSGGDKALREYMQRELARVAIAIKSGRAQWLSMDVLAKLPDKPFTGMVGYFAAGVAGAGEGFYEYRSTGSWAKL